MNVPKLRTLKFETAIIERYKRRESSVEEAYERDDIKNVWDYVGESGANAGQGFTELALTMATGGGGAGATTAARVLSASVRGAGTGLALTGTEHLFRAAANQRFCAIPSLQQELPRPEDYLTNAAIIGAIGGAAEYFTPRPGFGVCFTAGTEIATDNGSVAIECIQVGDWVWSCDVESGEVALNQVFRTF